MLTTSFRAGQPRPVAESPRAELLRRVGHLFACASLSRDGTRVYPVLPARELARQWPHLCRLVADLSDAEPVPPLSPERAGWLRDVADHVEYGDAGRRGVGL